MLKPAPKPVKTGLFSNYEQITKDPKMVAATNLPRNWVNILERFNDTELLNGCWVNGALQPCYVCV